MSAYSIPPLITAILSLFLCFFVIFRNPKSSLNLIFGAACFLTAYWQVTWAVLFNLTDPVLALLFIKIGYSGIIFIPIVFFHFIATFTNSRDQKYAALLYSLGVVFIIFLWFDNLLIQGSYHFFWGFYPKAGVLHPLYLVSLFLMFFRALYLLISYKRQVSSHPIKVNQVSYVTVSTVVYSLSTSDFLVNYGFEFYPTGFLFTTAYTLIIAIAIIEYRLLEINVLIRKTLVYVTLLLILLIPCYVLVVWGQELLFGRINYPFSLMTLALFIIVAFVFPKFRYKTEEALERVLFKKRYDYRATLYRSSRDMVTVVELEALVNKIVSTVSVALGTEKASLFLADKNKESFSIKAGIGLSGDHLSELVGDDPLVRRLRISPEALIREELEMRQNGMKHDGLAERMGAIEAEISLPLVSKDKLIGILNLGHRSGKIIYSNEDIEVLSTLANQTAIAIENAQLYENLKESQSIIHRANRLSSLGMLTAGLAHEIRNPLVAIRTFTQLLPERYDDIEFRENFQSIALKEVDRICGLVNDLLSFARPSSPKVSRGDVNEIVESITRILATEAKEKGITVNLRLAADLPKILVDKEQLKQVSMNVILNAIQSIDNEGIVEISSRLFLKDNRERCIQIEVRDTGIGIPERDLENIFNPFFTTKEDGSGLGLSISHQIVKEHGGYMAVESKVGVGTSFYINLPASQVDYRRAIDSPQIHEKDFGS